MNTFSHLETFNRLYKEMDTVHHNYAKRCGLSDMTYWILYSMAESDAYLHSATSATAGFLRRRP